jgi:hypothetical protein
MRVACFAAAVLTASAQAQWPAPGTIQHLGRLGPSDAREAARGIVSPDGTLFAYEVVHQHNRRIWLLNLTTGETRSLTPDPGVRYSLSWAADSRRLAYMYNQNTVRVADVDSSREREIFRRDPPSKWDRPYIEGVTWDADSALSFDLFDVMMPGARSVRWIAQLDGSNAHIDDRAVPRQRFASRRCCGGASYGVWMGARCIAGPVEYGPGLLWSPDQHTLVIATDSRLYTMRVPSGHAERIADAPGNIHTVTTTRAGALAITTLATGDSLGDLWLATPPFQTVAGDTLPGCPDPPEEVMRFIAGERLMGYRSTEVLVDLPQRQFTIFRAVYSHPGDDVSPSRVGLRYGDRIGWLPEPFRPDARDHALWSETFDRELRSAANAKGGWIVASVHAWLAAQPGVVPDSAIMRWLRSPPDERVIIGSALAARTPALRRIRSRDVLLSIADIGPAFAVAVIDSSSIRDDPTTLVDILRRPAFRRDPGVQEAGRQRLIARAPQLAADSTTSEPVLFELVVGTYGRWRAGDSVARLLVGHPAVRSSVRTLAVLAVEGAKTNMLAQARLAELGVSMDSALVELVHEAAADTLPPLDLPSLFMHYEAHVRSSRAMAAIAELSVPRYQSARSSARLWLAQQRDTPDSVLLRLARTLRPRTESLLGLELLANPRVRGNREILATIAASPAPDTPWTFYEHQAQVRARALLDSLPQ